MLGPSGSSHLPSQREDCLVWYTRSVSHEVKTLLLANGSAWSAPRAALGDDGQSRARVEARDDAEWSLFGSDQR